MKRPRRLNNEFQTDLDGGDLSEPIISVQKVGFSGLLAEIPAKEVKESFGTISEYLRASFGSGEYKVTIRKKGEAAQQRTIAVDNSELPSYGDFNSDYGTMVTLLRLQREKARLQAKLEAQRKRKALFLQLAPLAKPAFKLFASLLALNRQDDTVSVIKSITESLKESAPKPQVEQNPQGVAQPQESAEAKKSQPENKGALNLKLEEIIQSVVAMVQQKQMPKVVADYLLSNITYISEVYKPTLSPQMNDALLKVMQNPVKVMQNPVLVWDILLQLFPALNEDQKYSNEIRFQLQKAVMGK